MAITIPVTTDYHWSINLQLGDERLQTEEQKKREGLWKWRMNFVFHFGVDFQLETFDDVALMLDVCMALVFELCLTWWTVARTNSWLINRYILDFLAVSLLLCCSILWELLSIQFYLSWKSWNLGTVLLVKGICKFMVLAQWRCWLSCNWTLNIKVHQCCMKN